MENFGLNRVTLIGKIVQQPQLRYSHQGYPIAHVILTIPHPTDSEPNRLQQVSIELTDDHAEKAVSLPRGTLVLVEGGIFHKKPQALDQMQVRGHKLQVLNLPRPRGEVQSAAPFASPKAPGYAQDDELPF